MTPFSDQRVRLRAGIVGGFFLVLLGVVTAQAVRVQVFQGPLLSEKASREYERGIVVQGKRGAIRDRGGIPLAVSIDSQDIAVSPHKIPDRQAAISQLAAALEKPVKTIAAELDSGRGFVWLNRQAVPRHVEAVKALNITGVTFIPGHSRCYPNKTLAAQLVGFAGVDGKGLEGMEYYFNDQLAGREESVTFMRDAKGRWFEGERPPESLVRGNDVVLTLDATIQNISQKALEAAVNQHNAKSGMAIVMAPATGEILALAHYPFFNPNQYKDADRFAWRNRAVTDAFEPGSTLKIFGAAAALDSGKMTSSTQYFCENGKYRIGRHTIHDTKPHGWLSLQDIIKYSSNIGSVKMAEQLGAEQLHAYLYDFGFGQRTGVSCPGEAAGSLSPYRSWKPIDTSAISFGHGISVTALQLITAASALANDGVLMKPQLVRSVVAPDGRILRSWAPEPVRRVVSSETAAEMRRILETATTTGGTGTKAVPKGYRVCGKTGTARKLDESGNYTKSSHVASFVGFLPAENPQISILVVVDEPRKDHYGGSVAAPVFRQIAIESLAYLNVPPGHDPRHLQVAVSSVPEAAP